MNRIIRGLGALLILLTLLVGGPVALAVLWGSPWPNGGWSEVQLVGAATVVGLIVTIGWLAWAMTTACVAVEVLALATGTTPRRVPLALPGQQQLARALVASVAALGLGTGAAAATGEAVIYSASAAPAQTDSHTDGESAGFVVTTDSPTTCWKLAETHLGDGTRWNEILDLNRGIELTDGTTFTSGTQTIPAGTALRLPIESTEHQTSERTRIVERGENLWRISGEELDEPRRYTEIFEASKDTIQPDGMKLTDPDHIRPGWILTIPADDASEERPPVAAEPEPETPRTGEQARTLAEDPPPNETVELPVTTDDEPAEAGGASWLVAGLTCAGGVLGGALLLTVRANWRSRQRHRVPGQIMSPPPDELRDVEKTITFATTDTAHRISQLDDLLRTPAGVRPRLSALTVDDTAVTLHLAEPADLAPPWSGEGTIWHASLDTATDVEGEPPYPMLVSLGADKEGRTWFVDLETWDHLEIGGDPDRVTDLGRHLCASLALNPWSTLVRVEATGIGNELADLDPLQLHTKSGGDARILAVVTDPEHGTGRVEINLNSTCGEPHVVVDAEGRLQAERLAPTLLAAGLAAEDARVSAAIARTSREAETILADEESDDTESETAEPTNVSDPDLDADVAAWFDPDATVPKLTLLGPVSATAAGSYRQIAERKAYFTEMLAYLALHPEGVPAAAVAEAFSISPSRARTDIGFIRSWLGDDPRTGLPHLPAANASRALTETGLAVYQLDGVLTDVDLFRRLRARGKARGEAGTGDLVTALRLVRGEPFSRLRERGWSWLLDGERLHETITFAIVDTAHTVVADALEREDLEQAQRAADAACLAASYDEVARLDRIAVAEASGHHELAERMIREDIIDRTDGHLPPADLPERTKTILARSMRPKTRPAS